MKFVTFSDGARKGVGLLTDDGYAFFDLTAGGLAIDMLDLIGNFGDRREAMGSLRTQSPARPLDSVKIVAPIPTPRRNIFCIGKNYREHAVEFGASGFDSGTLGGSETPEYPIVFSKPPSAVIGPGEPVKSYLDPYASVDYEGELAIIIGKSGRVAEDDDPMSFVFGYTIINDVTSRELQRRHKQWLLGKGIDTFAPMGPAIVVTAAMPDLASPRIRTFVNGEKRQDARLGDLIFDIPTLVQAIGKSICLQAGDIIATGTPVGVGIGFKPPRYLVPGDVVRVEIDGIGSIENPIG